jgi:hypothetical protein
MIARVIPLAAWRAAQDDGPLPEAGAVALGWDVALDRTDAAVAAAWREPDGTARVELADYRPGVGWVVPRIRELVDKWSPLSVAYDAAGPALDVADVMDRGGLAVEGLKGRDYAAACQGFLEGVCAGTLRVRPHAALDQAAAAAAKRSLADAWAWGRRQSAVSIAPLTAATVALWAFDHAPASVGPFRIF